MINFKDNFFFAKFTILFFILTIFGFWGIDLNSEELYIAFSFFLLVIVGFILSRKSISVVFVKSINAKYFRFLSGLLVWVARCSYYNEFLYNFNLNLESLASLFRTVAVAVTLYFNQAASLFTYRTYVQQKLFNIFLNLGGAMYSTTTARLKKFHSFRGVATKFFSIKL